MIRQTAHPTAFVAVNGREMREIMKRRGMSVAALSTRSGVTPSIIVRVSHNGNRTRLDNLERIARALHVRMSVLEWPEI